VEALEGSFSYCLNYSALVFRAAAASRALAVRHPREDDYRTTRPWRQQARWISSRRFISRRNPGRRPQQHARYSFLLHRSRQRPCRDR